MTPIPSTTPLHTGLLWLAVALCVLLSIFVTFVGILSIRTGLLHFTTQGFWVPILAGTALLTGVIILFFPLIKTLAGRTKQRDVIRV